MNCKVSQPRFHSSLLFRNYTIQYLFVNNSLYFAPSLKLEGTELQCWSINGFFIQFWILWVSLPMYSLKLIIEFMKPAINESSSKWEQEGYKVWILLKWMLNYLKEWIINTTNAKKRVEWKNYFRSFIDFRVSCNKHNIHKITTPHFTGSNVTGIFFPFDFFISTYQLCKLKLTLEGRRTTWRKWPRTSTSISCLSLTLTGNCLC